jgi:hypothetical protein
VCITCLEESPAPYRARGRAYVPPGDALRSEEVTILAEVSPRQLQYWIERGVMVPSIHLAAGSGDTHYFAEDDVRLVATLGALAKLGCRVENLGPFSRWWYENQPPNGAHIAVVPDGGAVILGAGGAFDLSRFSPCWVVPAGG